MNTAVKILALLSTGLAVAGCGETATPLARADACDAVTVIESLPGRWEGVRATVSVANAVRGTKVEEFLGAPKEWRGVMADIEVCAHDQPLVLDANFTLCEESLWPGIDGGPEQKTYGESSPQDVQFGEPVFDQWIALAPGECHAGQLTFVEAWSGPDGAAPRPVAIVYKEVGVAGDIDRAAWRIDLP